MKLNCKPGDLAIVIAGSPVENIGKIIKVTKLIPSYFGPAWEFEGSGLLGGCTEITDYCLRPIRDPGEDAKDETLEWLPVPTPEVAAA